MDFKYAFAPDFRHLTLGCVAIPHLHFLAGNMGNQIYLVGSETIDVMRA